jgi:hypothetical protein
LLVFGRVFRIVMPSQDIYQLVSKPKCSYKRYVVLEGTIRNVLIINEGDGDLNMSITPDIGYEDLINTHNTKGMVVEVICWTSPDKSHNDKW